MKFVIVLLCTCVILCYSDEDTVLSNEEEECVKQTQVDREIVLADKKISKEHIKRGDDSKRIFNDYLGCYANKLSAEGKLFFTKNVFIRIPGYHTLYEIKSLWCDENYYSDANKNRPCAQRI